LRDKGIRIAIDDFGTGYSSLSYLRQVPVDVLKIDKSFIDPMAGSPQQRSLVETIVRLAGTLGLDVVAEGIQRPEERDMLAALGCPYGQGYLFSQAMPNADVGRWLAGHLTPTA
jgi:EAL domain-containing protein (putative c-di-GMP-specific phosphodiesterase class I)